MVIIITVEIIFAVSVIYFLIGMKKSSQSEIIEVVIAKAWQNRFAKIDLIEKCNNYIYRNEKYHIYSDKKLEKKKKADKKQIDAYAANEEKYLKARSISMVDLIPLFGYNFCSVVGLDAESDLLRKLLLSCEQSGYVELERGQETNGKKNSVIYAYYILASVISYVYMGIMAGLFLFLLMLLLGKAYRISLVVALVVVAAMAIVGYLPMDALNNKALNRKEEIDREFPNVVSKLVLLTISGMNVSNAISQTAQSGDGLIYQELAMVVKESCQSVSLEGALTHLQSRCDNKYLDKLVTLISKSFRSGNANLADDLRGLNDECWLEKKHSARRMADKVQAKLFIPTMLMFVGILVVIIIPVMSGFNLGI